MIYFARGSLPWEGQMASTESAKNERIKEKKMDIPISELCHDLPKEFATYLEYVRNLDFEGLPNYSYLRKLLRNLFVRRGYQHDNVFDWTIKRFFLDQLAVPPPQSRANENNKERQHISSEVSAGETGPSSSVSIEWGVSKRARTAK
jgi:hypothetical protein